MAKLPRPDDDLFRESTMSFGEHLDELRACLFKAVLGLVIGFLAGLFVAEWVVRFIESPLKNALEDFYLDKAVDDLKRQYGDEVTDDLENFIRKNRYVFEDIFVERNEIRRIAGIGGILPPPPVSPAPPDSGAKPDAESKPDSTAKPVSALGAAGESPAAASAVEGAEAKSAPESKSDGETKGAAASAEEADPDRTVRVHADRPPAPQSELAATRVWRPIKLLIKSLSVQEMFMVWLKAAVITGLILASPWIFYQVWIFVAAGLYPHEKSYVYIYLPISIGLFLAGAALAFFFVFQPVLEFLFSFNKTMNIDPDPRISEWLGFVLFMPLGFGISFQLPLVMLFLERIGVMTIETYLQKWRISILVIFVVSAVLTPADPISLLLMAIPLTFLYFGGIGLCRWMPKVRNPYADAYEP